jgi:hypothetical protein
VNGALLVGLESVPLERCEVDIVVAGFFRGERPLRHAAAAIDWRFCGLLSERLSEAVISGDPGEAVLLPSYGRMRAPRVLLLGLGPRAEYRLPQLFEAGRDAAARSIALGARSLALAPLGLAPDDFSRNAESLLSGALAGMEIAAIRFGCASSCPGASSRRRARPSRTWFWVALSSDWSSSGRPSRRSRRSSFPRGPAEEFEPRRE